jgi:hypothetical protein
LGIGGGLFGALLSYCFEWTAAGSLPFFIGGVCGLFLGMMLADSLATK